MKRYIIIVWISLFSFSCDKFHDEFRNQKEEIPVYPRRTVEEAREWAMKSISLIECDNTKSGEQIREIDSWNAYVFPQRTKSMEQMADTLLYVFNFSDNLGFSIISAHQGLPPLLAIVESGNYVAGMPSGNASFDMFMGGLIDELVYAENELDPYYWYEYVTEGEKVYRDSGVRWGQGDIYGKYCPNGLSGCVATAMAQIMTYYQKPSYFYTSTAMGVDFQANTQVPLIWSTIRKHTVKHTAVSSCDSSHNDIGALLREIGVQVSMDYKADASSAYDSDAIVGFEHFGYTTSSCLPFTVDSAKSAIKNYGPIYMSGRRTGNNGQTHGHAWVVDGYLDYEYYQCKYERTDGWSDTPTLTKKTLLKEEHVFHVNWGWNGDCNGYFNFGVFDIDKANSYDVSHNTQGRNYNINLKMIVVYP